MSYSFRVRIQQALTCFRSTPAAATLPNHADVVNALTTVQTSPGWFTRVASALRPSEVLAIAIIFNFIRDWSWGYLSHANTDIRFNTLPSTDVTPENFQAQMFAQWLYPTLGIVGGYLGVSCFYACQKWAMPHRGAIGAAAAASIAIIGWNTLQFLALYPNSPIRIPDRFTPDQQGYIAGFYTGAAEGPIQWLIQLLWSIIYDLWSGKREDDIFRYTSCGKLLLISLQFGLNLVIGQAPGNDWQVVFTANLAGAGPDETIAKNIAGGFYIAFTVGTLNYVVGMLISLIVGTCTRSRYFRKHEKSSEDGRPLLSVTDDEDEDPNPYAARK
jgi:hypothetical protein